MLHGKLAILLKQVHEAQDSLVHLCRLHECFDVQREMHVDHALFLASVFTALGRLELDHELLRDLWESDQRNDLIITQVEVLRGAARTKAMSWAVGAPQVAVEVLHD